MQIQPLYRWMVLVVVCECDYFPLHICLSNHYVDKAIPSHIRFTSQSFTSTFTRRELNLHRSCRQTFTDSINYKTNVNRFR